MFGSNFRDFVSENQSQLSQILKKSDSGDSGHCSEDEEEQSTNRAIELEFQLTQSLLSQVKAGENNEGANSGSVAYQDLLRAHFFVINDQTIDNSFITGLYAKYNQEDDERLFAKCVFTEMFKHAGAEVPNDYILEELITNCNQAGYQAFLPIQMHNILIGYELSLNDSDKKTMYIDYSYENCVRINYTSSMVVRNLNDLEKKICELDSSLEFTLQSRDSKVKYEDGKITLTIPEQLEDYKADGKNLLDDIKMRFEDADNAIIESLVENIGEVPKSFVLDLPAEVDSDSFDIIPENAVFDLGHIPELIKKAVDDKDVNALANHIGFFQDHVTHISSKEGLPVVEKTLEIVSGFIEEQGKAWNCHPTVPIASHIYSAKQQYYDGYISQADYEKVENLEKALCKIKSDLIKRGSNSGSPVINAQDISAMLNETPTSCQAVSREDNNQLNIKRDPEFKSTDNQQVIDELQKTINKYNTEGFTSLHVAAQKGDIAYNREINEGHKKSAKLLIGKGTSPYLENDPIINTPQDPLQKVSSLEMAKKRENKEFLEFMSSLGYSVIVDCIPSNLSKGNAASKNTKSYVVAASALAIAGIISGVAVAVYLEMLAVGIAVGACCLVAAAVIYCCTPKSSVESKNVTKLTGDEFAAQQTVN